MRIAVRAARKEVPKRPSVKGTVAGATTVEAEVIDETAV